MKRTLVLLTTALAAAATAGPAQAIIRGTPTDIAALPWTVALVESGEGAHRTEFCGATLIAPDAVLTAAHCVHHTSAAEITAVVSRTRLSDEGSGERVGVRAIHVAPGASDSFEPDFAVLELTRRVAATPVRLATSDDAALLRPGSFALAAGWGLTRDGERDTSDTLRSGGSRIASTRTCRRAYGDFDPRTMLCATGRQAHCDGDSGGPVVVAGPAGAVLVGVVSYGGDRCNDPDHPPVSARVGAVRGWIDWLLAALPRAGGADS